MTLRPEIKAFCDASETLLSPAIMQTPLTEDEKTIVKVYVQSLDKMVLKGTATSEPARRVF
jgi:hypothetical protein